MRGKQRWRFVLFWDLAEVLNLSHGSSRSAIVLRITAHIDLQSQNLEDTVMPSALVLIADGTEEMEL